ncbi:MAG: aminotransferase class I/II-fold pyridoxal phosphate-dependent enzyme [Pseudobutyrivibrio sp.]|nr:aminotransferase class I/II-fold pyridoxal phosphate-dependent enzyme [Pseudobutyrivibrio sp.]
MHGGDIYRNNIHFDFSVNLNPLGVPPEVQWVLTEAALHANKYPDIFHENLIADTARLFGVYEDQVLFGNGASELIMAICHAVLPKKALLLAPAFLGYEHCIVGASPKCEIAYHYLKEEDDFELKEDILDVIREIKPGIIFLTNPNNPNGRLIDKDLLHRIINACDRINCKVVVDECFLTLTGMERDLSLIYDIRSYKSLVVLRAFTKTFSIPGVRLGYAICSKAELAETIKCHLPEWNLSIFAQMAGAECLKHRDFVDNSVEMIKDERIYLMNGLKDLGLKTYTSDVNYILFRSDRTDLKDKLLEYSILIRDCSDYVGLEKGYYRVAIRQHNENNGLLSALDSVLNE